MSARPIRIVEPVERGASASRRTGRTDESVNANIAALGDLMLIGEWGGQPGREGRGDPLAEISPWLSNSVVFANLETTIEGSSGHIAKWPRVLAHPSTIRATLESLGVRIVNLANNHSFDAFEAGFRELRAQLEAQGILWFGAGESLAEARRPVFLEHRGIRFGWVGAVALDTCPSHLASEDSYGANPLHEAALLRQVDETLPDCDHLIVSLHWGVEFCDLPSPDQIRFARALVDRGVSLVLGHHAHVIQGAERYGKGVIAYGLGNATTADFYRDGVRTIRQSHRTRSSLLLRAMFSKQALVEVELIPIRCQDGRIRANDIVARRFLKTANRRLARGVSVASWKRRRLLEDVVLRTGRKLHPEVIRSVRWRHVQKFFVNMIRASRGEGPA